MIVSLRVTAWEENLEDGSGGRLGVEAAQSGFLCSGKRQGDTRVERAEEAKGSTWLQWRKVARKN